MNTTILHRLVWKELRTLRALWLSLLAMAFVLELGFAWIVERPHERSEWVFAVALYLPVVYSLACAAMAFAGEREEGTDQLLSRLAAPPMTLLSVKLAMNVLSTVVLLVILYPVAWMLAPWVADWNVWGIFDQADFNRIRLLAFAWGVSLFSWGVFFSLVFRRVLTCLISATVAATLTPLVASAILNLLPFNDAKIEAFEWTMRLALMPGLLLLASSWLVQTWDENRWPRFIELLLDGWHRRASKRGRPSDLATPNVQERGGWRMLVCPFGLCLSDELLSEWRRETRRLLWLEWKSVRWVFVGLVLAAALTLFGTAHSQADMRLVMTTLPMTLAFVAFVMGVWSFQGQQREQRFRFFAAQGASPNAMWLVKHVVWLSFAVAAVLILLGFAALASDRVGNSEELNASGFNRLVRATFGDRLPWDYQDRPVWPLRFVFLAAHATRTTSMEFFEADEVVGLWPLISLLLLSLGRGVLGAWLFFAIGQFVALVIPRAVSWSFRCSICMCITIS